MPPVTCLAGLCVCCIEPATSLGDFAHNGLSIVTDTCLFVFLDAKLEDEVGAGLFRADMVDGALALSRS